jgi:hypothetical protein
VNEVDKESRPRWRPRFSLFSALLLITIAGMAIVIVRQWRELGPMRAELRKLRDEVGALTIDDESKIHAIRMTNYVVPEGTQMWKWRVWVPEGESVVVRFRWGDVPRNGVPLGQGASSLVAGENIVTMTAAKSPDGKAWLAGLSTPTRGISMPVDPDSHFFDWTQMVSTGEKVGTTTKVFGDDSDIFVLERCRAGQYDDVKEFLKVSEPTAGFIIWLERQ